MDKRLGNKVAVVTGGSAGIGLGAAKRFAAEGVHVFIIGRRQSELADVTKPFTVEDLLNAAVVRCSPSGLAASSFINPARFS